MRQRHHLNNVADVAGLSASASRAVNAEARIQRRIDAHRER